MKAELITIGDELLIGQTIDTNGSWLAEQLNLLGITVSQISSIRDNREHIISSLQNAQSRSELVILTGGLGPTNDDITKSTLCEFFDSELVLNEQVLEKIEAYFNSRSLKMIKVNSDQAMLPNNCQYLKNERGTAINPSEAAEEKISLSDRFGLWIGFHSVDQDTYLAMIKWYVSYYNFPVNFEDIRPDALAWAMGRGNRSGRTAFQYILNLAMQHQVRV